MSKEGLDASLSATPRKWRSGSPKIPPLGTGVPFPFCGTRRVLTLPAVLSGEVEGTAAVVAVHQVHAGGARGTAARRTVRDVRLAVDARVARRTQALVTRTFVHARGAVLAQLVGAERGTCSEKTEMRRRVIEDVVLLSKFEWR